MGCGRFPSSDARVWESRNATRLMNRDNVAVDDCGYTYGKVVCMEGRV